METKEGGVTGKGFVRGDARINRKGRPKGFDEMRSIALGIARETVTTSRGERIMVAEAILRSWATSREPALQRAFIEYAFGKVPDKLEADPLENKTTLILHYGHERPKERDERLLGN